MSASGHVVDFTLGKTWLYRIARMNPKLQPFLASILDPNVNIFLLGFDLV
jgi:hypothetical protein